jgi:hypothetical protein
LISIEAPAAVGQDPVRSKSVTFSTNLKPQSHGERRERLMRRLDWKNSATVVAISAAA